MGNADVGGGVTANQAVVADEPEHAGEHPIAARAVVAVEQDDLVRLVAALIWLAWRSRMRCFVYSRRSSLRTRRLAHHEGPEALLAQLGQHGRGRYVGIPIGPAPMRSVGEDRRNDSTNAVVREDDRSAGSGIAEQNGMPETWLISFENAVTARR